MPNAVYRPELCIRTTLEAADRYDFPLDRIIFEFTEDERIPDFEHLQSIVTDYARRGFTVAIDDFGAGYAGGLNLLADLQPDLVKIDMGLVRDIDQDRVRRAICRGIAQVCEDLGIGLIAEASSAATRCAVCKTSVCTSSRLLHRQARVRKPRGDQSRAVRGVGLSRVLLAQTDIWQQKKYE